MSYNPQNPNGQSTSANSAPVVVASDQSAIPVSLSGGATAAHQTDGTQKSQVVDGSGNVISSTGNALDINIKSGNATTVTANAGTNLNTSALALDATLTSGNQQAKITDGTNIVNTLKGDGTSTGQVAQQVAPSYQSQTWSVSSVTAGTAYDVGNYKSVSVQVTALYTGTTPTITFQSSNDNSNWVSTGLVATTAASSGAAATTTTTTGIWQGPLTGRYFRLSFTGAYTSGTSTGTIIFSTSPNAVQAIGVGTISAQGTKANNSATATANIPVLVGVANAAQQSWTESNQVVASMDLKGNQRMRISDAAGNDRGANVNASNQLTVVDTSSSATGSAAPASAAYVGGIAETSLPTAASAGNLTGAMVDKFGRQVVIPNGMRDIVLPMTQLTLTSTTTETSLIAAVASTFNDLLSLVIINTSGTATQVDFRDSTGGTVRLSLYVPAGDTRGIVLTTPMPQNAVNTAWTAKCGTSVASVIITGSYIANK